MFLGTVRSNLDPFHRYKTEEIWAALDQVHLKEAVLAADGGLESEVAESTLILRFHTC